MSTWSDAKIGLNKDQNVTLGELIEILSDRDPEEVWVEGLARPHSYRGYYEDLAFEMAANVRVADMLEMAKGCLGVVFEGYKGGYFTMGTHTDTWVADYGREGMPIVGDAWWERRVFCIPEELDQ